MRSWKYDEVFILGRMSTYFHGKVITKVWPVIAISQVYGFLFKISPEVRGVAKRIDGHKCSNLEFWRI